MPTDSVRQFLDAMHRSGLLPPAALAQATQDLLPAGPATAQEAADRFVRASSGSSHNVFARA